MTSAGEVTPPKTLGTNAGGTVHLSTAWTEQLRLYCVGPLGRSHLRHLKRRRGAWLVPSAPAAKQRSCSAQCLFFAAQWRRVDAPSCVYLDCQAGRSRDIRRGRADGGSETVWKPFGCIWKWFPSHITLQHANSLLIMHHEVLSNCCVMKMQDCEILLSGEDIMSGCSATNVQNFISSPHFWQPISYF